MSANYRVAPIFLIRIAGIPFDAIDALATPATCKIARDLLSAPADPVGNLRLEESLQREMSAARAGLWKASQTFLAPYLIFSVGGVRHLLDHLLNDAALTTDELKRRNSRSGDRERHLLLYLQRVAAKNDTFSEFGPTGWGRIDQNLRGIELSPHRGIALREAFLERWTAHVVANAINSEIPDANMEVPALEPRAFQILYEDVNKWDSGSAKKRWLSVLKPIAELPEKFVATTGTRRRQALLDEGRARINSLGSAPVSTGRALYSAANCIGVECFRELNFSIGEELINQVAIEAAPWIDFWRDCYAFIASRVAAGLRMVLEKIPASKHGGISLPLFLRQCEASNLSLTGAGLVALSHVAFQEVKEAFREEMRPFANKAEHTLSPEECRFVRRKFTYPPFDEYTYPSADLQIAAESVDAVSRGEYEWILGELHPPVALLQHCMYWACPDKATLSRSLIETTGGKPNFYFGIFAADFTGHTSVHLFDAMPKSTYHVSRGRAHPDWRTVPPDNAEVYVDDATGDVCVRTADTRRYLGSFARAWTIPLGFHPFHFGMATHTPRLRCGNVIVQRRAWIVRQDDLGAGNFKGVSRDLVLAIERLRAQIGLPRYVYIRPSEQALRRSGAEGRDKDTKPIFVDLESYLFMEIFYRWLVKAKEIEVTEMLPDPDHLLWREADGRRTFELRTLIVPRT